MRLPLRALGRLLAKLRFRWIDTASLSKTRGHRPRLFERFESRQLFTGNPTIDTLTVNPYVETAGGALTLTANDVHDSGGAVTDVSFYRDANGDGTLETDTDAFLGAGVQSGATWSLTTDTTGFGEGTQTYFAVATDNTGASSNVASAAGYVTDTLEYQDDTSANFSGDGVWQSQSGSGYYNSGYTLGAGEGSGTSAAPLGTATWTFSNLEPGLYQVSADYIGNANNSASAPYTLLDGSTSRGVTQVNQQSTPSDFTDAGVAWKNLASALVVNSGTLNVELSNQNGQVAADAIRIEKVADIGASSPVVSLVDNSGAPIGSGDSVNFATTFAGEAVDKTFTLTNAGTTNLTLGAITAPSGFIVLNGFGSSTLTPGQSTSFTLELTGAAAGSYSGNVSFTTNDPNNPTYQLAVSGNVTTQGYLDNTSATFTPGAFSSAITSSAFYDSNFAQGYAPGSAPEGTATWNFTGLEPGLYQVAADWVGNGDNTTSATYTLSNGGAILVPVTVNQRFTPSDFIDAGLNWGILAGSFTVTNGTLQVQLSNQNGQVTADAIRIERVADLPATLPVLNVYPPNQASDGSVSFGTAFVGETGVNETFTVTNSGTANLTLGAITVPSGFSLVDGFGSSTLTPGQSTTFTLQMVTSVTGVYSGVVSFASNDPNVPSYQVTVSGYVNAQDVVDDDSATFTGGAFSEVNLNDFASYEWYLVGYLGRTDYYYYNSDFHLGGPIDGSLSGTATWTFTGLSPGEYQIAADWRGNDDNSTQAPYTFYDGGTEVGAAIENQQNTSGGAIGAVGWTALDVVQVSSGTLTVQLASPYEGWVVADAIQIERTGDLPADSQSVLSVASSDGTSLASGDSVNFGTTFAGGTVDRTFTVTNTGASLLSQQNLVVTGGFTVLDGFGSAFLAAGQSTTFTLQMPANAAGTYSGTVSFASSDPNNSTYQLSLSGSATAAGYLDNTSANFNGVWAERSSSGYYNSNYTLGSGETEGPYGVPAGTATWTFSGLASGLYQVAADYVGASSNSASAPYTLIDGSASRGTVEVNQQVTPSDFSDAGVAWKTLASALVVNSGTLTVLLSNQNGQVSADAIRIEKVADIANPSAVLAVVSGSGAPLGSGDSVGFGATFAGEAIHKTFTVTNLGTSNLTLGNLTAPSGFSVLAGFGSLTLWPGQSTTFTLQMVADTAGSFSGDASFTTNDPNNPTFQLALSGNVTEQGYLDNTSASFSGDWSALSGSGYYSSNYSLGPGETGGSNPVPAGTATWTFTGLEPGLYQVAADYVGVSGNTASAPYTLLDGSTSRGVTQVDQQVTPSDFTDGGLSWETLASALVVNSGMLTVQLSNQNGQVTADAIRIEKVADIASNSPVLAVVSSGGAPLGNGDSVSFGATFAGAAIDKTFTVTNLGASNLTLSRIVPPVGFNVVNALNGFGSNTLAPGQSTTFTLQLAADAAGSYSGDISFTTNDPNNPTYQLAVSGSVTANGYLDDSVATFSGANVWQENSSSSYYNSNYALGQAESTGGSPTPLGTASWTFTGLTPGSYQIAADWVGSGANTASAPYTFFDGATNVGSVTADQQVTPSDFTDAGLSWSILATSLTVSSGTLTIELSNQNGQVTADAIRIEKVSDLSPPAPVTVLLDSSQTQLTDGGSDDLGTSFVGASIDKTFTIVNAGTANLTLGTISLPSGFSLASGPTLTTLTPGQSTTFTVQLDAVAAGSCSGTLSIVTNDPNADPFSMTLSGTVQEAGILDNTAASFTGAGVWQSAGGASYYNSNYSQGESDSGSVPLGTATWTFNGLAPGLYQIAADYVGKPGNSAAAQYTLNDGATPLETVQVDQQQSSSGLTDAGLNWNVLTGAVAISSGTLTVQLSNLYGPVTADAIRLQWVGPLPGSDAPEAELIGPNGVPLTNGAAYNLGATFAGETDNATFTVSNVGNADLALSNLSLPSGFSLASGFGSSSLAPGQSTTFTVQLNTDAAGSASGALSFTTNDPNAASYQTALSGTVAAEGYLDNTSASSVGGSWSQLVSQGSNYYNSNYTVGAGETTSGFYPVSPGTETWTFTGLEPGVYQIAADYVGASYCSATAPYTLFDGGVSRGTVEVDQQVTPSDFSDAGLSWETLDAALVVTSGTLKVQLSNQNGEVIADAILIEKVADIDANSPVLSVTGAGAPAPSGGSIDFGSTFSGEPVSETLTVTNAGSANLTLGAITPPSGFSVVSGFGSSTLAPGQSPTVTLQLTAVAAGNYNGDVSFTTNDPNNSSYQLTLSGAVVAPRTGTAVDLSSQFNRQGMTDDGSSSYGGYGGGSGLDGDGDSLSATSLGSSLSWNGVSFTLGPADANNVVNATGQTISLPQQQASQLDVLAVATGGDQSSQTFVVTYTDGSTSTLTQGISNWLGSADEPGESTVATTTYVNSPYGYPYSETANVYGFAIPIDTAKTVASVTLPSNGAIDVLAISEALAASAPTLISATSGSSGVTLNWTVAPSSNVAGYYIYRGTDSGGESLTPLNSTPLAVDTTSYTDTSAIAGNTYYYIVQAVYGGSTASSNELSATLAASGSTTVVDLSSVFNRVGLAADGTNFSGGLDGYGDALSANALGSSLSWNDVPFTLGPADVNNVINATGQSVPLAQQQVSQLDVLAVSTSGDQPSQSFVVHYTDGTSTTFTEGISFWQGSADFSGEATVATPDRIDVSYGDYYNYYYNTTANVYGFTLAVNSSKTVASITLPNNGAIDVLAISEAPAASAPTGCRRGTGIWRCARRGGALQPLAAAMKATKMRVSPGSIRYSGCHCTPRQNFWAESSMPSMTPSGATAFMVALPGLSTAWWWELLTCMVPDPTILCSRVPGRILAA